MSDDSAEKCYVLLAYYSDHSGAKILGVFKSLEIPNRILKAQDAAGSSMELQLHEMTIDEVDPQDIFP
jgi:hypothetical protein